MDNGQHRPILEIFSNDFIDCHSRCVVKTIVASHISALAGIMIVRLAYLLVASSINSKRLPVCRIIALASMKSCI
jgi:hypothetical protein